METELKQGTLTIHFRGEINSSNATDIENEVMDFLKEKEFASLVFDFQDLSYISSAGLRVVLKVRQRYSSLSIINTSLSVYDIFEMTGFTSMMSVRKALKEVDISHAELIGEGYFSYVYRLDKDTIIKVCKRAVDISEVERELNKAKRAFVLGIPTAISFDIVKVGELFGVRFELLDCASLRDLVRDHPDDLEFYVDRYAKLVKGIGDTETEIEGLPSVKEEFLEKLEAVRGALSPDQYQKTHEFFLSIPERNTFVHGDCHVKNIMVRDDEFFLIDMDTLSYGHPMFEYALIYAPYIAFEEDDPGNCERFLGLSTETCRRLYDGVVSYGLGKEDSPLRRDQIKILSYVHMMWWNQANEPENTKRFEGCKGRLLALLDAHKELKF